MQHGLQQHLRDFANGQLLCSSKRITRPLSLYLKEDHPAFGENRFSVFLTSYSYIFRVSRIELEEFEIWPIISAILIISVFHSFGWLHTLFNKKEDMWIWFSISTSTGTGEIQHSWTRVISKSKIILRSRVTNLIIYFFVSTQSACGEIWKTCEKWGYYQVNPTSRKKFVKPQGARYVQFWR